MNSEKDKIQKKIIAGAEPFHLPGNGPKILLIHGFTATPTEMRPIGEFLNSKGYEVHSVLLSGHGTSPEDLQTKKWKDWWFSTKNRLNEIRDCDFVLGFSMGALLASRLAVEFQHTLKGVILVSTFMRIKPKIYSSLSFLFPLIGLFKPFIYKGASTEEFFRENNLISYSRYPVKAAHESIKLVKFTERNIFKQITIPSLIIQGEKDDRIHPESYKILMKKIPAKEKELVLLPNSQHIVSVGPDKELLFRVIHEFIKKHE